MANFTMADLNPFYAATVSVMITMFLRSEARKTVVPFWVKLILGGDFVAIMFDAVIPSTPVIIGWLLIVATILALAAWEVLTLTTWKSRRLNLTADLISSLLIFFWFKMDATHGLWVGNGWKILVSWVIWPFFSFGAFYLGILPKIFGNAWKEYQAAKTRSI